MRRGLLIVLSAATIATAGVAACPATRSSSAAPGGGSARVTVDGQPQEIGGRVMCVETTEWSDPRLSIAIGEEALTGVTVYMDADASVVHLVDFGNVNGLTLTYRESLPGEYATATKDGSRYTIRGTAGVAKEPLPPQLAQVRRSFEIDVTCP